MPPAQPTGDLGNLFTAKVATKGTGLEASVLMNATLGEHHPALPFCTFSLQNKENVIIALE